MKKTLAVTLYVIYALFVTLFIVYGGSVCASAITEARSFLYTRNLTDVTISVDLSEPLVAGKTYRPTYTAQGDVYRAGLKFQSLDPDLLTVKKDGSFVSTTDFDDEEILAHVRITSRYDSSFEKIVAVRFIKKFPESFKTYFVVKSVGKNPASVPLGMPIYVYAGISKSEVYNVKSYEVLYDESAFSRRESDGALIPIRKTEKGEKLTLTIRYANGAEATSRAFTVTDALPEATEFDEIRLGGKSTDTVLSAKTPMSVALYNRGERVYADFTLTSQKGDGASLSKAYNLSYKSAGEKTLRVTLPNGFYKDFTLTVRNKIVFPTLADAQLAESHSITIKDSEQPQYDFSYPTGVTYKKLEALYDESLLTVTVSNTYFTIEPKGVGRTTLTLLIDDGYEAVREDFTVEIVKDRSPLFFIRQNVATIVAKYIGHLSLFVTLSWFALNMFRFIETKNKLVRFIRYMMCGLPIAAVTEYWQTFLPKRTGSIDDAVVDMMSYYLGTLIGILAMKIYAAKKKRRLR